MKSRYPQHMILKLFQQWVYDEGSGVQCSFRVFAMTRQFQSKWRNKVNKEKETSVRDCLRTFGAQISCNEHSQWQNFWVFRLSFPWDSAVLLQLHKRGLTWHWNQKKWKFACEHMWDILRWFDLRNLIQKLQRQPTLASDYISRPTKKNLHRRTAWPKEKNPIHHMSFSIATNASCWV